MNHFLKNFVVKSLKEVTNKIDSGNCELTQEQAMDIVSAISHEALSKEQACSYLNVSRSKFGELIIQNKIPKGKKRRGFKELIWYKDELMKAI